MDPFPGSLNAGTGASGPSDDPLSINYIRLLRAFMSVSASWPDEVAGRVHPARRLYRGCMVCWAFMTVVGQIRFLVENVNDLPFFVIGQIYMTTFFGILCSIRTLLPLLKAYGEIVKEFLMSFHLINFKHNGGYYQKMHAKFEWLSYRVVSTTLCLGLVCVFLFNMIPVIINIKSGAYRHQNITIELAIYVSYPHFNAQHHISFVTAWNIFLVLSSVIIIVGIDNILLLMIFQIIGHIEVLRHSLTQIPKPRQGAKTVQKCQRQIIFSPVTMLDDQHDLVFTERIKQCVQHHLFIIRFTEKVSAFFGPVLAVYYVFYLITGCLMLLEMSSGDAASLLRYGPGTVVMFVQLIILSMVFEVVKTRSENLADTLYNQAWESASVANQRTVCMLLRRLQTPISVKALGVIPVNVQTMIAIFKTSLSYFAFLKTLDD